jgi:hypothetical protein
MSVIFYSSKIRMDVISERFEAALALAADDDGIDKNDVPSKEMFVTGCRSEFGIGVSSLRY